MDESQTLRECLGKFATGVTVVTCTDRDGNRCGITANSFSSVSLEPPLILWNIGKESKSLNAYLNAKHFAINILALEQLEVSHHFAQAGRPLFDGLEVSVNENDVPLIPGSLACLECSTEQVHEAGDHYIILGRVESLRSSDRKPLIFYDGDYLAEAE